MKKLLSWRLSLQAWFSLLALALVIWTTIVYVDLILEMTLILFGAFLFSLAIRPLADTLARWRVPRGVTVLGVYIGLVGILAVLGTLLVPVVSAETNLLRTNGPTLLQTALSRLTAMPLVGQWIPSIDVLTQNLTQYLASLLPAFWSTLTGVGDITLNLLVVLVLTYFLATDATIGQRLLSSLVSPRYQPQVITVMTRLRFRLTRWIWAQLAIALYFALTFGTGLALLGVPFALTIALVGGVLEVIPYVGGVTATVLGVLSALTVNPWLALWVILLYTIVAEVQSHIVAPAFYGRAMHLHPAAILIALFIGVKVKGIIGIFFAVPLAANEYF
jgi:predicted PurR-regulated permease PerM